MNTMCTCTEIRNSRRSLTRHGTALVAIVVVLVILSLVVMTGVVAGSRDQDLTTRRVQAERAKYAADASANMAIRELVNNADNDGDGTVGTISNDGNTATDPLLHSARLWATSSVAGSVTTVTARGANADAARAIEITVNTGSGTTSNGGADMFYTRDSSAAVRYSLFNTGTSVWGTASTSGTIAASPVWTAAACLGTSTMVMASVGGVGLHYGLANSAGTATYASVCTDTGVVTSRAFACSSEQTSGEGLVAYYDKSASAMRYRTVISSTLSAAASMGMTTGQVWWVQMAPVGTSGDEVMALVIDGNKHAIAARWTGSAWTGHTTLSTALEKESTTGLAVATEQTSGRMMAVMGDLTSGRVGYRIYTSGSGWSSIAYRAGFGSKIYFVELACVPGSNSIFMATMDDTQAVMASRWDGSAWSAPVSIVTATGSVINRRFDIASTPDGSDTILMYGKGTSTIYYRLWNGSSWNAEATAFTLSSGNNEVILAAPGPSATVLLGAVGDSNAGVNAWSWSGTAFGTVTRLETTNSSNKEYEWFAIPVGPLAATPATVTGWTEIDP